MTGNADIEPSLPIVEGEVVETTPLKPAPMVSTATPRKWWQIWKPKQAKPKRALLLRLFGIGVWGAIKLVLLCVVVGFIVLTMEFDPASPSFDVTDALGVFLKNAYVTAKWAMTNFWKPALAGASLVLPVWVLWRLISLPFRK